MKIKVNQDAYARVFKLLLEREPFTVKDIVNETGLHSTTVRSFIRVLRKHKLIHICGWNPDRLGRDKIPIYMVGNERDKPRHKLTHAQRQARYRAKKRGILYMTLKAMQNHGRNNN